MNDERSISNALPSSTAKTPLKQTGYTASYTGSAILERYRAEQASVKKQLNRPSATTTAPHHSSTLTTKPTPQRGWSPAKQPSATPIQRFTPRQPSPTKRHPHHNPTTPHSRSKVLADALARYSSPTPGVPRSTTRFSQGETVVDTKFYSSPSSRLLNNTTNNTTLATASNNTRDVMAPFSSLHQQAASDDFRIGAVRAAADYNITMEGTQMLTAASRANELQAQVCYGFFSFHKNPKKNRSFI